jgi:hypothetical protein
MTKEVRIIIHDDLDGSIDAETYLFGWAGLDLEIDLTEAHYKELHELLRPYLDVARPVKEPARPASAASRRAAGSSYANPDGSVDWVARKQRTRDLAKVRQWAEETQGIHLPPKGVMSVALQQQWNAAHPHDQIRVIGSNGPVDG